MCCNLFRLFITEDASRHQEMHTVYVPLGSRSLAHSAHSAVLCIADRLLHGQTCPTVTGWWLSLPLWKIWKSMGLGLSHIWIGKLNSWLKPRTRWSLGEHLKGAADRLIISGHAGNASNANPTSLSFLGSFLCFLKNLGSAMALIQMGYDWHDIPRFLRNAAHVSMATLRDPRWTSSCVVS
jgi:hypothetical protein